MKTRRLLKSTSYTNVMRVGLQVFEVAKLINMILKPLQYPQRLLSKNMIRTAAMKQTKPV